MVAHTPEPLPFINFNQGVEEIQQQQIEHQGRYLRKLVYR